MIIFICLFFTLIWLMFGMLAVFMLMDVFQHRWKKKPSRGIKIPIFLLGFAGLVLIVLIGFGVVVKEAVFDD